MHRPCLADPTDCTINQRLDVEFIKDLYKTSPPPFCVLNKSQNKQIGTISCEKAKKTPGYNDWPTLDTKFTKKDAGVAIQSNKYHWTQ